MNPIFPATYSTLCPLALSSLISEKYGLTTIQCRLLARGVGDTYLVESPGDRFIFRVYRSSHRGLPQIKEEIDLLSALRHADVPVSYPIVDSSGAAIQAIQAVEGERYAVLFSYARGKSVRNLTESQLRSLGGQIARFHNVSSIICLGSERWHFDLETTLFGPLKMLRSAFEENQDDYDWLHEMARRVEEKLSTLNTAAFSTGYCHFDFLPKNFHFEGDSVTLFDFDFMGYGWLVHDIMSFWQHLILDVHTGRTTQEAADNAYAIFLKGYAEHRTISEQELAIVPYISLGFWLFYMGFHTTHDQFYVFTQPAHLKVVVGFLKQLVERHWKVVD